MSENKTPEIRKTAVFQASIEKVWDAVSTSEGIEAWFMPNNFKAEQGAEFTIESPFGPTACKVLKLEAPTLLVFSWGEGGWEVSFRLKDLGGKTEFTLIHGGWGEPDAVVPGGPGMTNAQTRERMNDGWESIVNEGLRKVVEQ